MNDNVAAERAYNEAFSRLRPTLAGDTIPWVQRTRETALSRFDEQGFPTTRDEEWKYTNVASIQHGVFTPTGPSRGGIRAVAQIDRFLFADMVCHRLVFVDGYYRADLSLLGELPPGVVIASLASVIEDAPDKLEPYLGRYAPTDKHGFAALNTAFLVDGVYVCISKNTVVPDPIHVLFLSTEESGSVLAQPRNLVIGEEGSQAVVIENYASLAEARYFTNTITEVVVGKNAQIEHYKLGQESPDAFHIGGLYVQQQSGSRLISQNLTLNGRLVRNNIEVDFVAAGGECVLNGLYVATGRQHIDNHTRIDHAQPGCISREFYRGVLDGRARAVFNGRIVVHQDAQHTDAQQENKNLLLSRDVEVDTKPQLEIFADDVKCAHGATVGQLDSDALYYLRSRGMDEQTARSVLTYAFAHDVLDRIDIAAVRAYIERALTTQLLHGRPIEDLV
ncbi:MAG: Fe-S cluster assembly protein SufD [Acidiferrobacterales bacterium]